LRWVAGRPPGCLPSRRSKGRVEGRKMADWGGAEEGTSRSAVGVGFCESFCRKYSFGCSRRGAGGDDDGWTAGLARLGVDVVVCCCAVLTRPPPPCPPWIGRSPRGRLWGRPTSLPLGSGCWGRPQTGPRGMFVNSVETAEVCGVRRFVPIPTLDDHVKFGFTPG
jgi:hypothetical protein